jgi:hypothetical protein
MLNRMSRRTAFRLICATAALPFADARQAAAISGSQPNATLAPPTRPRWNITPLEGVGPLRFGMTVGEAAAALPEARELRRFQADHIFTEIVGIELSFSPEGPALYEYFLSSGQLYCIVPDAARGPLLVLNGMELTGSNPAELDPWLFDLADSTGVHVRYGPRGNPGICELGLILRAQDTVDGLRARPVLVGKECADRCADDSETAVPECEWVGYVWPDPNSPNSKEISPPSYWTAGRPRSARSSSGSPRTARYRASRSRG